MLGEGILVVQILVGDQIILGGNLEHVIDVEIDTFWGTNASVSCCY